MQLSYAGMPDHGWAALRRQERMTWLLAIGASELYVVVQLILAASRPEADRLLLGGLFGAATILLVAMATSRATVAHAAKLLSARRVASAVEAPAAGETPGHRMRNRLSLAVGYCELVAEDPRLPGDLREMLLMAEAGARAAADLADQVGRDADRGGPAPAEAELQRLSHREREVAALVARGLTSEAIAARLGVAPGTVANHLTHILRKLGFARRTQVAAWAVRHGLWSADVEAGGAGADPDRTIE